MHDVNRIFWLRCKLKYPRFFKDPSKVIEFGSIDINGSVREFFEAKEYIGVDWRGGKGVDLISIAHEVDFESESFDTVVSASMLEHDPHWKKSLCKMIELMKQDGVLFLSWGSALNTTHNIDVAPDGFFHALKAGSVINYLEALGLHIHEFYYEARILREAHIALWGGSRGSGEVVLVAFKNTNIMGARSKSIIEELLDEDKA